MFKHQSFFLGVFFNELFTLKFVKIICYFFLGSFAFHFLTKLGKYSLNLNFRFVSMSELEFFLLMWSCLKTPTL
jgi:hypothetical protein